MDEAAKEKPRSENPTFDQAETGEDVRRVILSHLSGDRRWYKRRSNFNNFAWHTLTFLVIVFGAAASILAALYEGDSPDNMLVRAALVALPALSALCGALLAQFRFKEGCRIREHGRISTERLICRAHLIPTDDRAEALVAAIALRVEAHDLEQDQASQITGGDRGPA